MAEQLYYHGGKIDPAAIEQEFRNIYKYVGGSGGGLNYSLEEQVAGTWIDGRPVFVRTWHVPAGPLGGNTVDVDTIAGLTYLIKAEGSLSDGSQTLVIPNPSTTAGGALALVILAAPTGELRLYSTLTNMTGYSGYVTAYYLK